MRWRAAAAAVPTPLGVDAGDEFHRCETCGYEGGFHSTFFRRPDGRYDVILVRPLCSQRYNLGLVVEMEGLRD